MSRIEQSCLAAATAALLVAGSAIGVTAVAETDDEEVAQRVAEASAEEGEQIANTECIACHTFEEGQPHGVGPNLWDVVGRPIASLDDFDFTEALEEHGDEEWTYANLDAYIADPEGFAPGTNMAYPGIEDVEERADVIAFLRSLSDDPEDLPDGE